jgi:hypothetical protein
MCRARSAHIRRSLVAIVVMATGLVGTSSLGLANAKDRSAARLLDSIPLPPTAQPTDIGDRARTYTTTDTPEATLAFLRDQLRAAGWTAKSVGKAPANNNGLGPDDAETPEDRATGDEGTGDTSSQQLTGPIRARWTMGGATLRLKIDDVATADPQQVQGEDDRQTTFLLRARPR